jgi:hypothetical protein
MFDSHQLLPLYVEHLGVRSHLSVEFMAGLVFSAQATTYNIFRTF